MFVLLLLKYLADNTVIIDLNKILNSNDSIEIKGMETKFKLNGWCVVFLPTEILDQHLVFQEQSSLSSLIECTDLPLQDEHFDMLHIISYFN
ncbi:unnamed protein product [Rotaria sordida]|uniref:Uncharacterized protein n=1 Tax=Rotaria sordida TaxID=392033 RepID=A0A815BG74_9BILA|nr:unnamed protein product [Rotaria sordida]CAF4069734.1 unnamed protein product [Rotaria sordida]